MQDFGTPIIAVETFNQGGNTRMVDRAEGPVGALGLPDRQPLHPRGQADRGGPEQAGAGHAPGLQGREAVAQLPERRSARGAAGDRRLHRPQHHHQRHGDRQPDAAAQGHPVGPGARHHHADQGPRHAQERQCRADRAARGARAQGEAAARERDADQRARAARHRVVPAQLHEGGGLRSTSSRPTGSSSSALGAGQTATTGGQGSIISKRGVAIVDPRIQHPVRAGHRGAARGGAQDHPPARHADPAGADRGAHRHRERQVQQAARRALRRADRVHVQQQYAAGQGGSLARSRSSHRRATGSSATRGRRRRSSSRRASRPPATRTRRSSTSTCRSSTPPASSR